MITPGFNQKINQIPKSLFDWLKEAEKNFPEIDFQIYFSSYKSEEEKMSVIKYERIYEEITHLRHVFFPRINGLWDIKLVGDQNRVILASGVIDLVKEGYLESFHLTGNNNLYHGYVGLAGSLSDEELIRI